MSALAIRLPQLLPTFRPAGFRRLPARPRPEPMPGRRPLPTRLTTESAEPLGVAWCAGQDSTLRWCWAASPAALLRRLSREIPAQVLRFSEAGHGLGILLRVAADELDASGAADPSRILALAAKLRPWVSLRWCGSQAELRQGQGAFAGAYVSAFLGWDPATDPEFQPEVPAYRLAEFQRAVGLPPA
ncbi:MAG: hypothetical protein EPN60_03110 [Nevskiaceae bacterium]|jgi:hypothetical protein|nr:MAG: hypothetical protein EPO48_09395 [Nevskiaceae bacterium]TAM32879.1 MAG: hypothetical protein EPN60_03110 [Nevskiaceae bacterium]